MNKYFLYFIIVTLCISTLGFAQENKKLAQTGCQFLSITSDAKVAALAGAVTGTELKSSALFHNPAGMANMSEFINFSISNNEWIADINHNAFSFAINPGSGVYGVFGISVQYIDYGEVFGTRVYDNDLGYIETGIINPSAMAVGLGYAKALTDRFSVGGQIKLVKQELGNNLIVRTSGASASSYYVNNEMSVLAYDFGTLFKTGIKSLAFGMSVRNFSQEVTYEEEGFQLPLAFQIGVSMNLMDLVDIQGPTQNLTLSIDATHFRSHPEQLLVGLNYKVMDLLSLRGGYVHNNDEDDFSLGVGLSHFGLEIDYAYSPFGVFDNVQRITARFSL